MANNISLASHLRNDPGDTMVVDITPVRSGAAFDGDPVLHYTVDFNPVFNPKPGPSVREAAARLIDTVDTTAGVRLLGVGESSDAYHMSAPEPAGKGAEIEGDCGSLHDSQLGVPGRE